MGESKIRRAWLKKIAYERGYSEVRYLQVNGQWFDVQTGARIPAPRPLTFGEHFEQLASEVNTFTDNVRHMAEARLKVREAVDAISAAFKGARELPINDKENVQ